MKNKLFILIFSLIGIVASVTAQDHLKIKKAFDKYGKQEGSILVQLSSDILSQGNSRIKLYKSLITDEDSEKLREITSALNLDIQSGNKISEVKKDGQIESGTYCVKSNKTDGSYEYILYKRKSKKITLVYVKGNFAPQSLDSELKKLKDLFIYVNNKRIKLQ